MCPPLLYPSDALVQMQVLPMVSSEDGTYEHRPRNASEVLPALARAVRVLCPLTDALARRS